MTEPTDYTKLTDVELFCVVGQRPDEQARIQCERERRERWWRTYDAALTGMLSDPAADSREPGYDHDGWHGAACLFADRAHGPLVKP